MVRPSIELAMLATSVALVTLATPCHNGCTDVAPSQPLQLEHHTCRYAAVPPVTQVLEMIELAYQHLDRADLERFYWTQAPRPRPGPSPCPLSTDLTRTRQRGVFCHS